jgi:hypothetical protein
MKTKLGFLFLVALSAETFGQKCAYTVDKTDPFTNVKVNAIVYTVNNWTWVTSKTGDKYFIELSFQSVKTDESMKTTDVMQVKLANGTILDLHPHAEVIPAAGSVSITTTRGRQTNFTYTYANRITTTSQTSTTDVSNFNPVFEVDRPVYEKLAASEITVIRFDFAGKPWDFDFSKKPLKKAPATLMKNANCILAVK